MLLRIILIVKNIFPIQRHQQAQIAEGDGTGKTSSLLAELIQAAGILPDNLSSESTNTVAAAAAATATTAISVTDVAITPDGPVEVIQGSNTFSSTTAQTKCEIYTNPYLIFFASFTLIHLLLETFCHFSFTSRFKNFVCIVGYILL